MKGFKEHEIREKAKLELRIVAEFAPVIRRAGNVGNGQAYVGSNFQCPVREGHRVRHAFILCLTSLMDVIGSGSGCLLE